MSGFRSTNGYMFRPSETHPALEVKRIRHPGGSEFHASYLYAHIDSVWAHFKDPERAFYVGNVVVKQSDDGEFLGLIPHIPGQPAFEYCPLIEKDVVEALRELYDYLDGHPAWMTWEYQPMALVRKMLAVDHTPEEIERTLQNEKYRELWLARAKVALQLIQQHFN